MPHTGGSKSIATLMAEKAENGIQPTRAQIFILTHKQRKDGRPLDEESAKTIDMINERLRSNSVRLNDHPPQNVAWEGNVYSQVLENEKNGYVRGLGLGLTLSTLWGSKSSIGNIDPDDSSNEVKRLEQKVIELTELNGKQSEEMSSMKHELSWMRQVMCKIAPNELYMSQNINGVSIGQVTQIQKS
ncbi:uncharacterized protein [Nicotiana tomentosiformis]|uniref:uncharacterized protein n=1 Tax=Nicotiana tomentosiformis TaxID=4098 RepID=UPI0008785FEE|nr:uncharacterized protein LOC108944952 [Nicotiana tomentosiformis]